MNAYIYQADIYCEDCGEKIREELNKSGKAPSDPSDEYTYDSDEYPKGPYPDGGGEADCEQICGACNEPLDNPLTDYGLEQLDEQE